MINTLQHCPTDLYNLLMQDGILKDTQKKNSKIFGVKESTLNGWINGNTFPDSAMVLMQLLYTNKLLSDELQRHVQNSTSTIPVSYGDKILLVKLRDDQSALYSKDYKGKVIAECAEHDNAAFILDFIH